MLLASMRTLTLLTVALLLAGCTFPGQGGNESTEDVAGDYESGVGIALAVKNDGNGTVEASLRVVDGEGRVIGEDRLEVAPGQTMVRRYAIDQHVRFTAQMSYHWDDAGRAASGMDSQTFETLECNELTRLDWSIRSLDTGIGSQFLGKSCESAEK